MSHSQVSHSFLISDSGGLFLFCGNHHLEIFQTLNIAAVILNNTYLIMEANLVHFSSKNS